MAMIKLNHITGGSGLTLCGKKAKKDPVPDKSFCRTCVKSLLKSRNDLAKEMRELKEILRGLSDEY